MEQTAHVSRLATAALPSAIYQNFNSSTFKEPKSSTKVNIFPMETDKVDAVNKLRQTFNFEWLIQTDYQRPNQIKQVFTFQTRNIQRENFKQIAFKDE